MPSVEVKVAVLGVPRSHAVLVVQALSDEGSLTAGAGQAVHGKVSLGAVRGTELSLQLVSPGDTVASSVGALALESAGALVLVLDAERSSHQALTALLQQVADALKGQGQEWSALPTVVFANAFAAGDPVSEPELRTALPAGAELVMGNLQTAFDLQQLFKRVAKAAMGSLNRRG